MFVVFFFKQKTAYEMRISDWSSDVCSSDLLVHRQGRRQDAAAGVGDAQAFEQALHAAVFAAAAMQNDERTVDFFVQQTLQKVEIGRASCRERVCQYV